MSRRSRRADKVAADLVQAGAAEAQNIAILIRDLLYQRYETLGELAEGEPGRDLLVYEIGRLEGLLEQVAVAAENCGQMAVIMALRETLQTTVH